MKQLTKDFKLILLLVFISTYTCISVKANTKDTLNVLLIGDSTTNQWTPRTIHPERLTLEQKISTIFNANSKTVKINTYNSSQGGETALSLFTSGRYRRDVKTYMNKNISYIFVRYGINDFYKCENVKKEFPVNLNNLIDSLKTDFPSSKIVLCTISPFIGKKSDHKINKYIKRIEKERNLLFLDVYTPFKKAMDRDGKHSYSVRMGELDDIPMEYHEWLKPYTYWLDWAKKNYVILDDNSLDYIFDKTKGWYNAHPNSAGYSIIAKTTADYLLNLYK